MCITSNQRLIFFCVIVFIVVTVLFTSRAHVETTVSVVNSTSRLPSLNLDHIKIDPDEALHERMISHKKILLEQKKNSNLREKIETFLKKFSRFYQNRSICADYWLVSFDYTEYILETAKRLPTWCIIVVLEEHDYIGPLPPNMLLFHGELQSKLMQISPFYKESLHLPKGLYSVKKNLGYLWAIYHQPKIIYDFDHNNELLLNQSALPFPLGENLEALSLLNYNSTLFNPYFYLVSDVNNLWPRGYPFQMTKDLSKTNKLIQTSYDTWPIEKLALIQALAEGYKFQYNTYFFAKPKLPLHLNLLPNDTTSYPRVIAPSRTFSPYDQQSTFHLPSGFWALMLPVTVKQYISDTMRSYIMQRLMWDVNLQVAFAGSFLAPWYTELGVEHTRVHFRKSAATRQGEVAFYWKIHNLVYFLSQWSSRETDFIKRAEQLFSDLHEQGFIKLYDVYLLQLWLYELNELDYILPKMIA